MSDLRAECVIDLIRHGEPVGGRRYRGHAIDDPLTEKGWSQMWNAVGKYQAWQQIITSPLSRCHAFANELGKRHDIAVSVEPRFKEVGFGSWEGCSHDEIKQNKASEYAAFINDPVYCRPPGTEDLDSFIARVSAAYEDILVRYANQHCLIVAHAGVIRAIISKTVNASPVGLYRIKIDHGGLTRIRHTKNYGTLEFLNGTLK